MSLQFRQGVDARHIALIHEKIAMARKSLHEALFITDDRHRCVLDKSSQHHLDRLAGRIQDLLYGLEKPFCRAVGMDMSSPFANTDKPSVWIEWLNAREGKGGTLPE